MNAVNTIAPDKDLLLEISLDVLDSIKSEIEIKEETEPSISTRKNLPRATTKLREIRRSTRIGSDKKLVKAIESITEFIELSFSEQNKNKSALLDIKISCETLSKKLNRLTPSDKKQVCTLKSLILSYGKSFLEQRADTKLRDLEETLGRISSHVHRLSSADKHIKDALEKLVATNELWITEKNELKLVFVEVQALLDKMLNELSRHQPTITYVKKKSE